MTEDEVLDEDYLEEDEVEELGKPLEEPIEEDDEEEKGMTAEELKEYRRNVQKGIEKKNKDNKLLFKTLKEIKNVAEEPAYLVKLSKEDPKVAKIILAQYYDGMSLDQYSRKFVKEDVKTSKKEPTQDIESILDAREADKELKSFVKDLDLDEEQLEKFMEEYNFLQEGKQKNIQNTLKFAKLAFAEISDDLTLIKQSDKVSKQAEKMGVGGKAGVKPSKAQQDVFKKDLEDFFKTYG